MKKKVLRNQYRLFDLPLWDSLRTEMVWEEAAPAEKEYPEELPLELKPTYVVGTWFLKDTYRYLCRKPVEVMHYVSGVRFENYYTLERITEFTLSVQSAVSVKGDLSSSLKSLMDIEGHGYCLTGWFHSHPGTGKESVFVSATDINTQKKLEAGEYQVIGGIFSQDGYIRFFSDSLGFRLMVLGKGVEGVDENVYKISKA